MRRAALSSFRAARRSYYARRHLSPSGGLGNRPWPLFRHPYGSYQSAQQFRPLESALYFRQLTVALISSLVASGAWYVYRDNPSSANGVQVNTASASASTSSSLDVFTTTKPQQLAIQDSAVSPTEASEDPVESIGRALIVENDQFFTADLVGDKPLSKDTEASGRLVMEMLTPDQATQKLRKNEESYFVGRGQGVVRYDVIQLASNNPIEDDHAEKIIEIPDISSADQQEPSKSDWMFWGVFDGHSGWTTSAKLRQLLIQYVAKELNHTHQSALAATASTFPSPEAIDAAIKNGFVRLDNEIVHESVKKAGQAMSKQEAVEALAPAFSGSCALLSFYDSKTKLLRVACTGDSRAVLGRKGGSGKWIAKALSEDQTGGTPSEDARLRKEHPGELYVTHNGRILGQLEPSRAFGDAIYKWSRETAMKVKSSFFGKTPSPRLQTPPYVTAEPIITTTKITPENNDFLVMATDGLWECLTNEEVVGLVGQWLDTQGKNGTSGGVGGSIGSWFSSKPKLPVESQDEKGKKSKSGDGQRVPIRQEQWQIEGGDERFVVEDKNVATHLIRNALGGKDQGMVCALLTLQSPYSRRYRDDLTVQVIFFGNGRDNTFDIRRNVEATTPKSVGAAKL